MTITVHRRKGESVGSLVRRFRHTVIKSGVLADHKRHRAAMSKGERKRWKRRRAAKRRERLSRRS